MRASRLISTPARPRRRWCAFAAVVSAALAAAALPGAAAARSHPQRHGLAGYHQRNLVADKPGHAEVTDPNLVNAWGLSFGPTRRRGSPTTARTSRRCTRARPARGRGATTLPLVVKIPEGAPTGTVFNGGDGFEIDGSPSRVPVLLGGRRDQRLEPGVRDRRAHRRATATGAIYKGLAIATTPDGPRLYATDFHNGRVDVWDDTFAPAGRPGGFTDPKLPKGFAPFGIQTVRQVASS